MKRLTSIICALVFAVCMQAEYKVTLEEELSGNKRVYAYVDGIKVSFTFDTGCSSLSVNKELFEELVRKGAVKWSDLSEEGESELANGETHMVRYFTIKRFQLGDCVLRNVRATLGVHDQPNADLLLGQSILSRFEYYTIKGNVLSFSVKPESEQQAFALAIETQSDTSYAINARVVEALKPYKYQLSPRFMVFYAKALECVNRDQEAIAYYDQALRSPHFTDKEGKIYTRKLNAKINSAEQLYGNNDFAQCETMLQEIIRESQKEPVYTRGLRYAYSSLCYVYGQMEDYAKEEQAILQYANYLLAPKSYDYLEHHTIEPNEDLARLLNHIAKYYSHVNNEEKAKRYEKMSIHAGWKE